MTEHANSSGAAYNRTSDRRKRSRREDFRGYSKGLRDPGFARLADKLTLAARVPLSTEERRPADGLFALIGINSDGAAFKHSYSV